MALGNSAIFDNSKITLNQIFNSISIHMNGYITHDEFSNLLVNNFCNFKDKTTSIFSPFFNYKVIDSDVIQLINQYVQLGLFEENYVDGNEPKIRLTKKGLDMRSKINLIYKETKGIENENTDDQ